LEIVHQCSYSKKLNSSTTKIDEEPTSPDFTGKANFGERITYYRYTHGLTPKEFGNLVHADASTVLAWEVGKHIPSKRRMKIIERFINDL
jgi:DNA-binding transcriptional regulator YiaG